MRFCIFWKKATGILQTDTLLYRKPSKRRKREADQWRCQPIDLFYARFQKDFLFFHQAFAEFECPLAILRKYGFVTKVLCFAVEPGEVVTAVVIHLKRIRGKQCLAMAEKELHPVLIALEERAIPEVVKHGLRYVHRENKCRLLRRAQRLAVVVVVQILEEEPLGEGAHLACDLADVDRTAKDDGELSLYRV